MKPLTEEELEEASEQFIQMADGQPKSPLTPKERYNEFRMLMHKIEDGADAASHTLGEDHPGGDAALEGIASTSGALRSELSPEDFEEVNDG